MPAVMGDGFMMGDHVMVEARAWDQHANRSIMSPTALAFLIPVLVVFFFAPFLCVFCVQRRRRAQPARRIGRTRVPALERSEARERLESVAEVSNVIRSQKESCVDRIEEKTRPDSGSFLEKECAICLSTLLAPSPPEPAKLNNANEVTDEVTKAPSVPSCDQEEILRLKDCGHEFHAECLISWVVLHKNSCPICRTVYYHEEPEKPTDVEAQNQVDASQAPVIVVPIASAETPVRNWHYFWTGRDTRPQSTRRNFRTWWRDVRGSQF